jgi:hypothetical protein
MSGSIQWKILVFMSVKMGMTLDITTFGQETTWHAALFHQIPSELENHGARPSPCPVPEYPIRHFPEVAARNLLSARPLKEPMSRPEGGEAEVGIIGAGENEDAISRLDQSRASRNPGEMPVQTSIHFL